MCVFVRVRLSGCVQEEAEASLLFVPGQTLHSAIPEPSSCFIHTHRSVIKTSCFGRMAPRRHLARDVWFVRQMAVQLVA